MSSALPAIDDRAESSREWPIGIGVAVAALLLCLGFVYKDFFVSQLNWAVRKPSDWGHTLIIPLMALYLAWLSRARLAAAGFRTTWIGLIPLILGVALYVLFWLGPPVINNHTLRGWSVGLSVFGIVLLFFGWKAMRWLIFPIMYCFAFGVTIGDRIMTPLTYRLQDIAAQGSFFIFKVFQFDVMLEGNTLRLWQDGTSHDLNIAEACSGMRMLVAFLALGVFMAATMLNHNWQRITLVILALPVAVFVNMLRVVTLGLLGLVNADFAAGDFHTFIGLVWLVPAFLIYLGLMWILRRVMVEDESAATTRHVKDSRGFSFASNAWWVTIVACATLLTSGLGFRYAVDALNVHLMKRAVPLRRELSLISRQLGAWQKVGDDRVFSEAIVESLGTEDYLSRDYERESDTGRRQFMQLHVAFYTDQLDAVPHVPERCIAAQGRDPISAAQHLPIALETSRWVTDDGPRNLHDESYSFAFGADRYSGRAYQVRMPLGEPEVRVFAFPLESSDAVQFSAYFFVANGWWTARSESIRLLAFDPTDEYAYYCKVEFSMIGASVEDLDSFVEQVTDLINPLLPELMRCLPDWSEVENGLYPPGRIDSLTTSVDAEET